MTATTTTGRQVRRWAPHVTGWMVCRRTNRYNRQRPVMWWCGPEDGAGFSFTTTLKPGCDALVWSRWTDARADIGRVFPTQIAASDAGFTVVRVISGRPMVAVEEPVLCKRPKCERVAKYRWLCDTHWRESNAARKAAA